MTPRRRHGWRSRLDGRAAPTGWVLATPAGASTCSGSTVGRPDPGAQVTLVTLVLDAPALDAAPRGTGVLVAPRGDATSRAKALTHATAKWPWLARPPGPAGTWCGCPTGARGRAPRARTTSPTSTRPCADAARLLGTPLAREQLHGSRGRAVDAGAAAAERRRTGRSSRRCEPPSRRSPGVAVCGAWVAGNGLASVVPDARAAVAVACSDGAVTFLLTFV